ncbi:alpha/beta hydrolase [Rhodomicrobium sp. Az07]|uniref:alpha/beta fold hydrolase n=1 Tax=Rhodomicrobium sp. Az07 TaxID=2839034 RepID=UPI001BE8AA9D|nr:alpha/beta fold hydrolase [Rhodomicrobium sp. Az07]MBT3072112.1 alpha/beta hydrolase [Rhodomicrobium sp. Az07]
MEALPALLIPGLGCDTRLYGGQLPVLFRQGATVTVANHTRSDSIAALADDVLAAAPPRFALTGLSMGGYIALEILRRAPDRVARLALLDTTARPDSPEQTARRKTQIEMAQTGKFGDLPGILFPIFVHASRRNDHTLRAVVENMILESGADAFVRQQTAIIGRRDSRPYLGSIRCPTLVVVGYGDELTPPALAKEIADPIPGAKLEVVPDCGHLSTLEQPDFMAHMLAAWHSA